VKSIKELLTEIELKYNKNPKNWNLLVGGRDRHGHGNIFISNKTDLWQLKVDSLFKPNPYGVGMKLGPIEEFSEFTSSQTTPSFGLRPLLPTHIDALKRNFETKKPINKVIEKILNTKPVSIDQMTKNNYIMGPIMHSSQLGYVSESQKQLDQKLKKSLDTLLFSKGLGTQYG
jgi:hypothetical protein